MERAKKNVVFDGKLRIPVLALNITGDSLAWSVYDSAYESVVRREGKSDLLRMTHVHGPGHCGFTAAERIATFETMLQRLDTGRWPDTSAAALNAARRRPTPAVRAIRRLSAADAQPDVLRERQRSQHCAPVARDGRAAPHRERGS